MAAAPSLKRIQIDKTARTMVIFTAVAVFLTIFSLLSSKALIGQLGYQNRVIGAKQKALTQLKADVGANQQLAGAYKNFVNTNQNLIGGNPSGTGANDGDNAKIVLDALPSQYDFPALTTSLQNLLSSQGVNIDSISGTDQQASVSGGTGTNGTPAATTAPVTPSTTSSSATTAAAPGGSVAMPFQVSVDGPYQNIQNLVGAFEKSIRPFQFQTMQLSGNQSDLTLTLTAQTFYQPEKDFKVTMETIK